MAPELTPQQLEEASTRLANEAITYLLSRIATGPGKELTSHRGRELLLMHAVIRMSCMTGKFLDHCTEEDLGVLAPVIGIDIGLMNELARKQTLFDQQSEPDA